MRISGIKQFLESPLGEALLSDVAIMGGMEVLKSVLRANTRAKTLLEQSPQSNGPPSPPPPIPKDLSRLVLQLTAEEIKKATAWIKSLNHPQRVELTKLTLDELKKLLSLDPDLRTEFMSVTVEPSVAEELAEITKFIKAHIPKLLNDESKKIIKGWETWADNVIARHKKQS